MTGKTGNASRRSASLQREAVADAIADELTVGGFVPGDKLPSERDFAQRFGVSRPVVREVLRRLEERGLVEVLAGRGTYIKEPSHSDIVAPLMTHYRRRGVTPRDVVEVRTMIEPVAAARAAERATQQDLDQLLHAIESFEAARSPVARARYDVAFHFSLVTAAHNPVAEALFASIAELTFELVLRSLSDSRVVREGIPYHREIYEAVRRHDPDAAHSAADAHLAVAQRLYGRDLDRNLTVLAQESLAGILDSMRSEPADVRASRPLRSAGADEDRSH